ncbi:haloacid dehalogenase [Aeromicrobium sp. Root495]|nr:haloacid dehalogenase [Aeromicrobium sp. Root495]
MTLIDSRPGIKAVYDALVEETGTFIDTELVVSRLGPPVEWELAHWFPEDQVQALGDRYRELYPDIAIDRVQAWPGAAAALAAVRAAGGRTVLITAKVADNARLHVEALGLDLDDVRGSAWREGKADALREVAATAYVGDHEHDMVAASLAGIPGIGVSTGPSSPDELRAAGAAVVIDSLESFPDALADLLARER